MVKKDELFEHMNRIQNEIISVFGQIDHYESFKTLLCLLDSSTSAQTTLQRKIMAEHGTNTKDLIFFNHNFYYIQIIYTLIDYVLTHAKILKSIEAETPNIMTCILTSLLPEFPDAEEYLAQYCNLNDSEIVSWEFNIHNDPLYYKKCFVIRNGRYLKGIQNVKSTIRLIQMFWKLLVSRTALTKSSQFIIDADGKIKFQDLSNQLVQNARIDQRSIGVEQSQFPSWDSKVIESQTTTLRNIDDLTQNRQDLLKEFVELKSSFELLPNFKNLFMEYYKMSLDDYFAIKTSLCMLSYDTSSRIIRLPRSRLIKHLKQGSGKSKEIIEKVLDDFTWKKGDTIFEKFLIYDGNYFTYSFDIALYSTSLPLHACYEQLFNNDKKGWRYEEECRKIFKTRSLFVCDGRLVISQQIVPTDFFRKYNAKVKRETDLDVVGVKSKILFIIECKVKKEQVDLNPIYSQLKKHYEELLWKVQWISEHGREFITIAKNQNYEIPDFNHIVPLLVTNIVNRSNTAYNSVNFTELKHILDNFLIDDNLMCTITLPTGIEISIPAFKVRAADQI